jgi:hypothetical protein
VFWNVNTKEVYLVDISLPKAPAHKHYQLWAFDGNQPINAGELGNYKNKVQQMKACSKADAFMISLEGSDNTSAPTEIYLSGKLSNS